MARLDQVNITAAAAAAADPGVIRLTFVYAAVRLHLRHSPDPFTFPRTFPVPIAEGVGGIDRRARTSISWS